jgi:hypothetical protein
MSTSDPNRCDNDERDTLAESKVLKKHPYLVGKYDLSSTLALEDLVEGQIQQMDNEEDNK